MLAAGMFEYNFGDSEFLMLFLVLVTLPYAADRAPATRAAAPPSVASRLTMSTFDALLGRIAGRSILVVGDLMLDHFVFGRVDRISPEAPVPVVQFDREEYRLGGAANVAHNIAALGGRAQAVGVIGADSEAARLLAELQALGVDTTGIVSDPARCTTRKLRVVTTRNQQVARIDYESDAEVDGALEDAVVASVVEHAAYGRRSARLGLPEGSHLPKRRAGVRRRKRSAAASRSWSIRKSRTSTTTPARRSSRRTITRQRRSRTCASGPQTKPAPPPHACGPGRDCQSVLITRGEHGMWLLAADGETDLPAEAREVSDVTGAGDTVIAALALGLAAGASLPDAAHLANRAAGVVVGKFGPATVNADEIRASRSDSRRR